MNATIVIKVPTMKIASRKPMPNPSCAGYRARNGFKLLEGLDNLHYKSYVGLSFDANRRSHSRQ
jgi:hypothetical protein